jgi:hypothetical protein
VFSYLPTPDQFTAALQAANPDFDLSKVALTPLDGGWFTDNSVQMHNIRWSSSADKGLSVGSATTFSFDESLSLSAKGDITEGFGGGASVTFSSNQSKALTTLHTTVEQVGKSTGVTVTKPGTFQDADTYQYAVQMFILGESTPNTLVMEDVAVSPPRALLNERVEVSALFCARDGNVDGLQIRFHDGDPSSGAAALDVEYVSHVDDGIYQVRVPFRPRTCGRHTIFVAVRDDTVGTVPLDVTVDPADELPGLRRLIEGYALSAGIKNSLTAKVRAAERSFANGNTTAGLNQLHAFRNQVAAQEGKKIPGETADVLLAEVDKLIDCAAI